MNYSNIKYLDVSNGEGIRTSLFVSGCKNHCKGCFNQCTWDFLYGNEYTDDIENNIINSLNKPYVKGLSLLGGDPMEIENQPYVLKLIEKVRKTYGNKKDIWLWSGYLYDKDLIINGCRYIPNITDNILDNIDYMVDGPFILEKKNLNLKFRGSSNQRIIDVKKTRASNEVVLYEE